MGAVLDERIYFTERTFVEQEIDPLTCGQASLFVLCFNPFRATAQA
jgi:hypothetical protein